MFHGFRSAASDSIALAVVGIYYIMEKHVGWTISKIYSYTLHQTQTSSEAIAGPAHRLAGLDMDTGMANTDFNT